MISDRIANQSLASSNASTARVRLDFNAKHLDIIGVCTGDHPRAVIGHQPHNWRTNAAARRGRCAGYRSRGLCGLGFGGPVPLSAIGLTTVVRDTP